MKGQPLIPLALIAAIGLFLMLTFSFVGLGVGDEEEGNGNGNGNGEVDSDDPVAMGEELFEQSCLDCHGDAGVDGTAPEIAGMDIDAVLQAIEEGPGTMPAGLVSGEEADAVAEYVASLE